MIWRQRLLPIASNSGTLVAVTHQYEEHWLLRLSATLDASTTLARPCLVPIFPACSTTVTSSRQPSVVRI